MVLDIGMTKQHKFEHRKAYPFSPLARDWWNIFRFDARLRLIRYAVIGVAISLGYTLNVVLFVEFLGWNAPALASMACFVIWTPISYIAHRDFTFLFSGDLLSSGAKFAVTFIGRLAASAYSVYVATSIFGKHYLIGVLANWIVLPLISYLILKLWVFRSNVSAAG